MKNSIKVIIGIVLVILAFIGLYFLSEAVNKPYYKEISYEEYKEIKNKKEKEYIVIGENEDYSRSLKTFGKSLKKDVYYLNTSKLNEEQIKEIYNEENKKTALFVYEDGKITEEKDVSLKEIDVNKYFEIIKEDKYNFIFIGSATCGYCIKFKPELQTILLQKDVNIYYLDISKQTEEDLKKLYDSDTYFTTEEWGTPLNFLYKNGEKIGILNGYNTADNVMKFLENNNAI